MNRYLPLFFTVAVPAFCQVFWFSYITCTVTRLPSGGLGLTMPVSATLSSRAVASLVEIVSVTWYFAVGSADAAVPEPAGTSTPAAATARVAVEIERRLSHMVQPPAW